MQKENKYAVHRTKYNVNKDVISRTYKGITYDSVMEMRYFIEVIEPMMEVGYITYYERQKKYVLQESFKHNQQTVLAITYVADYYIEYSNGHKEVIDIKGMPDGVAKIKRKLFWKVHPEIEYKWITYNKTHGGWVEYDELQKTRRAEKRAKERLKKAQDKQD